MFQTTTSLPHREQAWRKPRRGHSPSRHTSIQSTALDEHRNASGRPRKKSQGGENEGHTEGGQRKTTTYRRGPARITPHIPRPKRQRRPATPSAVRPSHERHPTPKSSQASRQPKWHRTQARQIRRSPFSSPLRKETNEVTGLGGKREAETPCPKCKKLFKVVKLHMNKCCPELKVDKPKYTAANFAAIPGNGEVESPEHLVRECKAIEELRRNRTESPQTGIARS